MAKLAHHGTTIRFLCDHLWQEVHRQIDFESGSARSRRLERAVLPIVPGASIVLCCSYVERVAFDLRNTVADSGNQVCPAIAMVGNLQETQRYFDLDLAWEGWNELANFFRLRHCFAHEFGRLLDKQRPEVLAFLRNLRSGQVSYGGTVVQPYFDVVNDEVVMQRGWNNRLRIILVDFLRLFQKHGLTLVK